MRWLLWVPGKFKLTNEMLSDLRAAGFYQGKRAAMGTKMRQLPYDMYSAEVQKVRILTSVAARKAKIAPDRTRGPVRIMVVVYGHRKHDPDAWYLLAKAAIDGLTDAKVLASDRSEVAVVMGRVLQTEKQEAEYACPLSVPVPMDTGFAIEIEEVRL